MPWKAPSGTPRLSRRDSDRLYDRHRLTDPALAEAKRIRSSRAWKEVRALVLARQPLCLDCLERGHPRLATDVDHVLGLAARPDLAYDPSNLRPLCRPCHARKSARERAGRG